jgi:peptide chain release factor 3
MQTYAVNWPIGMGDRFKGVFDRRKKQIHLFERTAHGSRAAKSTAIELGDPQIEDLLDQDLYYQFKEELEMIEELGPEFDLEAVHAGQMTPVFFGSAMTNFGVQLFLDAFLDYALKPGPRDSTSRRSGAHCRRLFRFCV